MMLRSSKWHLPRRKKKNDSSQKKSFFFTLPGCSILSNFSYFEIEELNHPGMGCVNAKTEEESVFFKVSESKFGEGKLEINSKEMIFYRKGCESILFSLKHLRKYGVDLETNVFCFEAGRSCLTGAGIYPFKSQQANDMFETLKSYIEGIDSSTTNEEVLFSNNSRETQDDHLNETLNELRTQRALDQESRINNYRKTFQIRLPSVSGMSPQIVESSETPFLYENQLIENNNSIDAVPSSSYVNVTAITPKSCKSVFFDETIPRNYENSVIQEMPLEPAQSPTAITYTVLELTQEDADTKSNDTPAKSPNGSVKPPILTKSFSTGSGTKSYNGAPLLTPDSQDSLPQNYAVIDFQRTNALANSTGNPNGSTGVRKTRHHSEDNFLFEKSRNILLGV